MVLLDTENKPLNAKDNDKYIETDPSRVTYTDKIQNEFLVHPAFTSNVDNGGGFGEISGFWISKFGLSENEGKLESKSN